MQIKQIAHKFKRNPSPRRVTNEIVIHHSGGHDASASTIHQWHLDREWIGIGYHFVIRYDGSIETGRPIDTQGAHAGATANNRSIGICVLGNFDNIHPKKEQIDSLVWLISEHIFGIYGKLKISGHKDHMSTSCPGNNFPMDVIKKLILERMVVEMVSKYFKDIRHEWQATHVDSLREKGIVSGRTADTYDPDSPVTRAELAVVVNKAIEYLSK